MDKGLLVNRKKIFMRAYSRMYSSIERSFDGDSKEIKNEAVDNIESALHALMDFWERVHDMQEFSQELRSIMKAFRIANDKLKHTKDYDRPASIINSFSFPIMFPMCFDMQYSWGDIKDYLDPNRDSDMKRYPFYEKYLKDNEVRCTFKHVIDLLEKEINL